MQAKFTDRLRILVAAAYRRAPTRHCRRQDVDDLGLTVDDDRVEVVGGDGAACEDCEGGDGDGDGETAHVAW